MPDRSVHEPQAIDGFRLVGRQRIPIRRLALIGLLSAPLWAAFFIGVISALGASPPTSVRVTPLSVVIALLDLTIVMPAVHEVVHGITARFFGMRPTYGVGAGFAYTTFREPVRPVPYFVIGLAPLLVISIVGIVLLIAWPFAPGQILVFLIGNGDGAIGDLWIAMKIPRLPQGSLICDLADGFAYYLPTSTPSPRAGLS